MKKYYIFVGNFGSGKSEIAINAACRLAKEGPCTLVDIDVVNPYFRSSERGDVLKRAGVKLISPPYAMHKIEIMSLSAEIYSVFTQGEGSVVFDAGGDPVGAIALGQYRQNFDGVPKENINVLMVINPYRPLAGDAEKAIELMGRIEETSRLTVTGLINNANLVSETGAEEIFTGYRVVQEMSEKSGVPVYATAGMRQALAQFERYAAERRLCDKYIGRLLPLDITMHRTWDKFIKEGL